MINLANKNILITGGAGFIGSHLCERLLALGANITIIDNFSTGKVVNIKSFADTINIVHSDICDYKQVNKACKGIHYIFHLAYPYGVDGRGLHQGYVDTGVVGTYNVLRAAVENNVTKVVNISSVSAYGLVTDDGTPLNTSLDESRIGKQFLHYGVTKLSGEMYCKIFVDMYGLDSVSLRLFYGYGPRYATFDHSALVNFLNRAIKGEDLVIYGSGTQLRDYTYVTDIVNGIILSLNSQSRGDVYNISGGTTCSIKELAQIVTQQLPTKSTIRIAEEKEYRYNDKFVKIPQGITGKVDGEWIDQRNFRADTTKAYKDFGWKPSIQLEDGIIKMYEWMIK